MYRSGRAPLFLFVVYSSGLCAQSGTGVGLIAGQISDSSRAPVLDAAVTVESPETGYRRTVRSGADGRYQVVALPVGSYSVEVAHDGFQTARRTGMLTVGGALTLHFQLEVGAASTRIEVTAEAPLTAATESADSSIVGERSVANLPIRGRNFVEFAQLTPGVSQEGDRGGLVAAGQRSINSNVSVDGMDFNDSLQGNQRGGNDAVFFSRNSPFASFRWCVPARTPRSGGPTPAS